MAIYAAIVSTVVLPWDIYKWKQTGSNIEVHTGKNTETRRPRSKHHMKILWDDGYKNDDEKMVYSTI